MKNLMKQLLVSALLIFTTATSTLALTYNEAKTQNKPIVIMFHMHGCGACRSMSPRFDQIAAQFANKFNFVKEDINGSAIASKLQFDTVPAIFIIEPKTEAATRVDGDCAWDNGCFSKTLQSYGK